MQCIAEYRNTLQCNTIRFTQSKYASTILALNNYFSVVTHNTHVDDTKLHLVQY